jgi:hypothetical protein
MVAFFRPFLSSLAQALLQKTLELWPVFLKIRPFTLAGDKCN